MVEFAHRIGGRTTPGPEGEDRPRQNSASLAGRVLRFSRRRILPLLLLVVGAAGLAFIGLRVGDGLALGDQSASGKTIPQGALSPDGRLVAVIRNDGGVDVIASGGAERFRVRGHAAAVVEARFTDDGKSLVTVDRSGAMLTTLLDDASLPILRERVHGAADPEGVRGLAWNDMTREAWRAGSSIEHSLAAGGSAARLMDATTVAPVLPSGVIPAPGQMFRDCDGCPQMVVLPAGKFMMGSPETEAKRSENEGPQRAVVLAAPVAVGRFEVTVGEFRRFVAGSGYAPGGDCTAAKVGSDVGWASPGFAQTDQSPVTCVSWTDAEAYVRWLSGSTVQIYRLLSEAEWEYAARAGSSGRWSFGENEGSLGSYAWYSSNSEYGTYAVGTKTANAFGLHDMHGNVFEWVQDCYADSYIVGQPSNGSAYQGGSCSDRVLRGGSWSDTPQLLRSALRNWAEPTARGYGLGFRVARTLSSTP